MIKILILGILVGILNVHAAPVSTTPSKPVYKTVCLPPQPGAKVAKKKCVKMRIHKKFKGKKI